MKHFNNDAQWKTLEAFEKGNDRPVYDLPKTAPIGTPEYDAQKKQANNIVQRLSKDIDNAIATAKPEQRDGLKAYRDSLAEARRGLDYARVLIIADEWKGFTAPVADDNPLRDVQQKHREYHERKRQEWLNKR